MVTSSAVVGSSAISRSGPQASADGDHHALALAARQLVRVGVEPPRGLGHARRARAGAAASARAARASRPRCRRSGSAIWRPTVCSGLSAVIGSWKTIAMRSPRSAHIAALVAARPARARRSGCCRTLARPSGSRPISASAVIDLPQPDSPTSPASRRASSANVDAAQRLRGAARGREGDAQVATSSSGAASRRSSRPRQLRIEQVAQPVAQQVEAEHRERDRQRRDRSPAAAPGTSASAPR